MPDAGSRSSSEGDRRAGLDPWILAALLLAAAVRVFYLCSLLTGPFAGLHRADQRFYRNWAAEIAEGRLVLPHAFEQGPLYAYGLGLLYSVFGERDWLVLTLQLGTGVVVTASVYVVGRRAYDLPTARLAAFATAVYGPLLYHEGLLMKSFLTPLLTTLVVAVLVGRWPNAFARIALAAAGIGLLCLVRESYSLAIPIVIAVGAMEPESGSPIRRIVVVAGLVLGVVSLVTLPATVHNAAAGRPSVWVTTGGGEVLYMGWRPGATGYYEAPPFVRPDPFFEHEDFRLEAARRLGRPVDSVESARFWTRTAALEIASRPSDAVALTIRKLLILGNDFEVPDSEFYDVARRHTSPLAILPTFGWFLGPALLGLFVRTSLPYRMAILGMIGVHVATVLTTYNFGRFRLGATPLGILLASAGTMWIVRCVRAAEPGTRRLGGVALLVAVLVSGATFLPPPGYAEAGYPRFAQQFDEYVSARQDLLAELDRTSNEAPTMAERFEAVQLASAARLVDRAEMELRAILEADPGNADALLELGVIQGQRGRFDEAAKTFETLLEHSPTDADAWANLGSARVHSALKGHLNATERRRRLEFALDAYERGLEVRPDHPANQAGRQAVVASLSATPDNE